MARLEAATAALEGRAPMPLREAQALIARVDSAPAADVASLSADRAEASAQLEAALGLLSSLEPPAAEPAGDPASPLSEQPPPYGTDVADVDSATAVAVDSLRSSARAVLEAAAEVSEAQQAAARAGRIDADALSRAEQALADADAARDDVAPAWRRAAGALISGTGMAILIAALSWPEWVFLVPAAFVAVMAADLRMAGAAARAASIRAAEALGAAGVAGREGLERARARQRDREATAQRLEEARRRVAETRARWAKLAPAADPADVETLVARLVAEATPPPAHPKPPADPRPAATPDAEADQARVLAQRLVDEARAELERAERALCDLADLDLARKSVEWHTARAAAETTPERNGR